MKRIALILVALVSFTLTAVAQNVTQGAARPFLCCDHNGDQVCIVAADGKIEWRMEAKRPQDCWLLPSGNILFCHLRDLVQ